MAFRVHPILSQDINHENRPPKEVAEEIRAVYQHTAANGGEVVAGHELTVGGNSINGTAATYVLYLVSKIPDYRS